MAKIDTVLIKLQDVDGSIKKLDKRVAYQNGRIGKTETEIALVKQRHEIESKFKKDVDYWSRRKLLFYGTAALVFIQLLFEGIRYLRLR